MDDDRDIPCKKTDTIRCKHCNNLSLVSSLLPVEGYKFPIPSENGKYWTNIHHYCRCCTDKCAKVFDPGDGTGLILGANVELVKSL